MSGTTAGTIINFCPTGMVPTKAQNPHVPISVQEIVEETHAASEVGITIAHLHARHADGRPAWQPEPYRDILEGVRRHCPDLVVCFSTSGRDVAEFEKRSAVIELQPDMCSLTLGSMNFAKQASVNAPDMIQRLALKMRDHGVKPELECFDLGMINYGRYLIGKGMIEGPSYWNLLFGNIAGMQVDPVSMGAALAQLPATGEHFIALGGIGADQFEANTAAINMGHGVRVGLEDNLWLDADRLRPATNLALLQRVHGIMAEHGRHLMPSRVFGQAGFYHHAHHAARVHG